jgi:dipeptidyl-peptidase-3
MLKGSRSLGLAFILLLSAVVHAQPGATEPFRWETDQFADTRVLRYRIPGWEQLSLQQKKLAYYLTMAGLSGRDIMWDQNYKHNLKVRRALEKVLSNYKGTRSGADWDGFLLYAKQVFFNNGIHHHYSNDKFIPGCSRAYFDALVSGSGATLSKEVTDILFDPAIDAKKVCLDASKDLVVGSAVNFYGAGIGQQEVKDFYTKLEATNDTAAPLSFGLNSKLVRAADGRLEERTYRVGGLYGTALAECTRWLEKAAEVAENDQQRQAIRLLAQYYRTGDLQTWNDFNLTWVMDTTSTVDFIQGFVEVYNDPLGKRGSYESIVQVTDPEATRNMSVIQRNAQWFEDNSPLMPAHKKKEVTGITYRFINTVGESGDAAPSTPIGVNLPNADWIREIGSKSVSLGNITEAYDKSAGKGALEAFCNDQEEIDRAVKYGKLAGDLHTALHEVIGHASGQLEAGVGTPDATLESYASTLEEGRADLVALYYLMDPKLIEMKVMPSLEVGKAEYDGYIRNGLMVQLRRLKPGTNVEEAHMRNRQWVSAWVLEHGAKDSVIVKNVRGGRTYYDIRNYEKLRSLFGDLLREVQRIKSQGDLKAGSALVETYGVKVDQALHAEVLTRAEAIKTAPYAGFIQPRLVAVTDASGVITDVKVEYPMDLIEQMLEYGAQFSFLPDDN